MNAPTGFLWALLLRVSPEESAPYDEPDVQHEESRGGCEADLGKQGQAIPGGNVERMDNIEHRSRPALENPAMAGAKAGSTSVALIRLSVSSDVGSSFAVSEQ